MTKTNTLLSFMNEFQEHKLVKLVNKKDGNQIYSISMPSAYIHKIIDEIKAGLGSAKSSENADNNQTNN